MSLGGLQDRTVEYTTWVLRITIFAQSFHYNREFQGQSCSAVLIFRNPRKAMFAPKSDSRGVAGSYCWVYYIGKGNSVFAQSFHCNREFWVYYMGIGDYSICLIFPLQQKKIEAKAVRLYSFSATSGKQCLLPKVSLGGLRDRTVEYITWVLGITVFAQSFHYNRINREFRGQSCSAVLIVRNPRKAMFHPKNVSRGVAGSYCSVYYMGIGDYSICSIFPLQQRISRPKLFGCNHFPQPPESNVCPQKCL